MPEPHLQISGLFLSFTDKELAVVYEGLKDFGYEQDVKGLKKWILDQLTGEEMPEMPRETAADRVMDRLEDYLIGNPEAVKNAAQFAGKFAGTVLKKIGERKKAGSK